MATEKTSLLHNHENSSLNKSTCYVEIPKQLLGDENNNYVTLTHEQLMQYVDDPWWQYVRKVIMIFFWFMLFAMLASACIISAVENRQACAAHRQLNNGTIPLLPNVLSTSNTSLSLPYVDWNKNMI